MVKNKHAKKASVMSLNVYYIELFIMLSKMYALYQVTCVKYNLPGIQTPPMGNELDVCPLMGITIYPFLKKSLSIPLPFLLLP